MRDLFAFLTPFALTGVLLTASVPTAAAQSPLPLDTSRIPTGQWSYRITAGGQPVAELVSVIRREEGRLVSVGRVEGADRQYTEAAVRVSDLGPISSRTDNRGAEGTRFEAEMVYGPAGDSLAVVRRVLADTGPETDRLPPVSSWSVPAERTFDLYALDMVLAALPLDQEGGSWSFRLVDPTSREPVTVRVQALGSGEVRTPSGRFQVWRVRVEGQAMPVEYDFRKTDRVMAAQRLPTQGVVILLTSEW